MSMDILEFGEGMKSLAAAGVLLITRVNGVARPVH